MPTYEFRCPSGHSFERFYRKIADAATELECPVCGKVAARQLSGGAGLLFKGSGFYLTDYGRNAHRKDDGGSAAPAEKAGASESKSESGASKGESKPDSPKSSTSGGDAKGGDKSSSKSESSSSKPSSSKD